MTNIRAKIGFLQANGKIHDVFDGINTIGRHQEATVIIKCPAISQHHSILVALQGKFYISDVNSTNGTFLDTKKLIPFSLHEITSSCMIKFGNVIAYFYESSPMTCETQSSFLSQNTQQSQSCFNQNTQKLVASQKDIEDLSSQICCSVETTLQDNHSHSLINKSQLTRKSTVHDLPTQLFCENVGANIVVKDTKTQSNSESFLVRCTQEYQLPKKTSANSSYIECVDESINSDLVVDDSVLLNSVLIDKKDHDKSSTNVALPSISAETSTNICNSIEKQEVDTSKCSQTSQKNNSDFGSQDIIHTSQLKRKTPRRISSGSETPSSLDLSPTSNIRSVKLSKNPLNSDESGDFNDIQKFSSQSSNKSNLKKRKLRRRIISSSGSDSDVDFSVKRKNITTQSKISTKIIYVSSDTDIETNFSEQDKKKKLNPIMEKETISDTQLPHDSFKLVLTNTMDYESDDEFIFGCTSQQKQSQTKENEIDLLEKDKELFMLSTQNYTLHSSLNVTNLSESVAKGTDQNDEFQEVGISSTQKSITTQKTEQSSQTKNSIIGQTSQSQQLDTSQKLKTMENDTNKTTNKMNEEESRAHVSLSELNKKSLAVSNEHVLIDNESFNQKIRNFETKSSLSNKRSKKDDNFYLQPTQKIQKAEKNANHTDDTRTKKEYFYTEGTEKIELDQERLENDKICQIDDKTQDFDEEIHFQPTQKIDEIQTVDEHSQTEKEELCIKPNQKFSKVQDSNKICQTKNKYQTNSEDLYLQATQLIEESSRINENFDTVSQDLFIKPTQKICETPETKNSQIIDEEIFNQPTQKICEAQETKKSQIINEEIFIQPTQKICQTQETENKSQKENYETFFIPTQKIEEVPQSTRELLLQATEKLCHSVKSYNSDSQLSFSEDSEATTNENIIKNESKHNEKLLPADKEVFSVSTQKCSFSKNVETKSSLSPKTQVLQSQIQTDDQETQCSSFSGNVEKANIEENVAKSNQSEIESQLEIMFASQNISTTINKDKRPSNPLATVLNENGTQDIEENSNELSDIQNQKSDVPSSLNINKKILDSSHTLQPKVKMDSIASFKPSTCKVPIKITEIQSSTNESEMTASLSKQKMSNKINSSCVEVSLNNIMVSCPLVKRTKNTTNLKEYGSVFNSTMVQTRSAKNKPELSATITVTKKNQKTTTFTKSKRKLEVYNIPPSEVIKISDSSDSSPEKKENKSSKKQKTHEIGDVNDSKTKVTQDACVGVSKEVLTKEVSSESCTNTSKRITRSDSYKAAKLETAVDSFKENEDDVELMKSENKTLSAKKSLEISTPADIVTRQRRKRLSQIRRSSIGAESNSSIENFESPSPKRKAVRTKVVFTMLDDPALDSTVRLCGGTVVDNIESATVLVTGSLKRTEKLLAAIGLCKPICSPKWLEDSKKRSKFLDPWEYLLLDPEAEKKWNFSLKESFKRSSRKKLFEDYLFHVCLNNGVVHVLKSAIVACGSSCVSRFPAKSNKKLVVVANPENKSKYKKFMERKPPVPVLLPEAIFHGVLTQNFEMDSYLIK